MTAMEAVEPSSLHIFKDNLLEQCGCSLYIIIYIVL